MNQSAKQLLSWRRVAAGVLAALAIGIVGVLASNWLVAKSRSQVHSVAKDLVPTLLFENNEQTSSLLLSLAQTIGVERVELVSAEGGVLAHLGRVGDRLVPIDVEFTLASVQGDDSARIQFTEPVLYDGLILANLHVVIDSWAIYKVVVWWLGGTLMLFAVLSAVYGYFRPKLRLEFDSQTGLVVSNDDPLKLEAMVSEAMRKAHMSVEYQPIYRLNDGGIYGFELMVCWQHPNGQTLYFSTADFLTMTQKWNISLPLDEWILRSACQASVPWQNQYGPLVMCLGLSETQLTSANFIQFLHGICKEHSYPSQLIELQVAEEIVAKRRDVSQIFENFLSQGIHLTLSKFGLAAQSLSRIEDTRVIRKVKLDGKLIANLESDPSVRDWVKHIVDKSLAENISVIAEGIKNASQERILASLGCFYGQGPCRGGVMTAQKFEKHLASVDLESKKNRFPLKPTPALNG
jgi:EAL domain-containing protein (putative c-di-GMP-specific phosphodiesterase class I)